MRKSNVVRLQVELDPQHMEELEELQELGGLRTKKDLWNNAITLLKWAAREEARGASIFSINEEEGIYKELELPFLETYATNVRRRQRNNSGSEPTSPSGKDSPAGETPTSAKKPPLLRIAAAAASAQKTRSA